MDAKHLSEDFLHLNFDCSIECSIDPPPSHFFLGCSFVWPSLIHVLRSSSGIDGDQAHKRRETGLIFAGREGHLEIVRLLVKAGADINCQRANRETALIVSVAGFHLELVKLSLSAEANLNFHRHYDEETALHIAASEGAPEIVKLLSTAGTDVNAQSNQGPALHLAASEGHLEIVEI